MSYNHLVLPFPRGQTYGDDELTLDSASGAHLIGRIYEVEDTEHGTGTNVLLRIVQLLNAITAANKLLAFSAATALDHERKVSGWNTVQGDLCKPLDDAYPVGKSLAQYDLVYVTERGPCSIISGGGAFNLAARDAVTSTAAGTLHNAVAAAGQYVVGQLDQALVLPNTNAVVWVNEGLVNSEA